MQFTICFWFGETTVSSWWPGTEWKEHREKIPFETYSHIPIGKRSLFKILNKKMKRHIWRGLSVRLFYRGYSFYDFVDSRSHNPKRLGDLLSKPHNIFQMQHFRLLYPGTAFYQEIILMQTLMLTPTVLKWTQPNTPWTRTSQGIRSRWLSRLQGNELPLRSKTWDVSTRGRRQMRVSIAGQVLKFRSAVATLFNSFPRKPKANAKRKTADEIDDYKQTNTDRNNFIEVFGHE